ncbi:MAG: hypothetical protein L3J37_08005 [Rhodobacteraceae bacterium]|nr:hypothetical protein [Paracoccaceae bacterium]
MNTTSIAFDPMLPLWLLATVFAVAALLLGFAAWRGLKGWWLRTLALVALALALANPLWREENRIPETDAVVIVVDETSSQTLTVRPEQTATALAGLQAALAALPNPPEVVLRRVEDAGRDGTLLVEALREAAGSISADRLSGVFLLTDGVVADAGTPYLPAAPVQQLLTGEATDWDRSIIVKTAPAFGIVGEEVQLVLRIEDKGAAPDANGMARVIATIDGGREQVIDLPLNADVPLNLTINHAGINLLEVRTPEMEGELTGLNNRTILSVNGVRDRLRVLLISGEPYAGERTWRNLLKADASVDLVHFTILRSPEKQDGVPYEEMSLIAFPTQELFTEKIDDFDLIIFDRFRRQGVLPQVYIENVANYVSDGGAVLIASGPSFASAESLYRSPLRAILPAAPTGRVLEQGFLPRVTEIGKRHPVTQGLEGQGVDGADPTWGRWMRIVEVDPLEGDTVMAGPEGRPLLQLSRVGEGRLALLTSDQAWLWSRGYEGGGPQRELLRRLAHWLMKEPELEENVLIGAARGMEVVVERQMLSGEVGELTVVSPSGAEQSLAFELISEGRWRVGFTALESGVYRLREGDAQAVVATGPVTPVEFVDPIATSAPLAAMVSATGGGNFSLEAGLPGLRVVREGRVAAGRGWMGIVSRGAYTVQDVRLKPLAAGWIYLLVAAFFSLLAWRIEGR